MERKATYGQVLAHRTTRHLWLAAAISVLGDFIGAGALLVLAFERSGGQAIGTAGIFASTAAGSLAIALFGGTFLDRISRKSGLVNGQLIGAAALLAPLLLDGLWPIYAAGAVIGAVRATTASLRQGALADTVPDSLRAGLIGMLGANDQFAQVLGYAAGAGFAVVLGAHVALWIDVASFLVGAAVLAHAALPGRPAVLEAPSLTRGLRTVAEHRHLRILALLVAVTATTTAMPESLAAVTAGGDESWTPALLAAAPAGTGIGFLLGGRLRATEQFGGQLSHLTVYGMALLLGFLAGGPAAWFVINVTVGMGSAWVMGPQLTFVRMAPAERMAQVTATMVAVVMLAEGAGSLVFGAIADGAGPRAAYVAAGSTVLLSAGAGWLARSRRPLPSPELGAVRSPSPGR